MSKPIDFFVPGEPLPQDRPRHATRPKKGGGTYIATFDTSRCKKWKETIATEARAVGVEPFASDLPLAITTVFYLTRPKSVKRQFPTVKPDLDNFLKAVKDALKGVAWGDDGQVVTVSARKEYAPAGRSPGVWVGVREVEK